MKYENATIITLGGTPVSETGLAMQVATFEEAFGEHSNLFGKKARARRKKRKASRRSDRAAKRTARREARMANVTERTEMRKARRGQRATARQETRDARKRGRQERRISRRADRKRQRQDMRDEQQMRRQARKDIRRTRRMERQAMGEEPEYETGYDDYGYDDQGYADQGYDDQGYGLPMDDQGYDDYGYDDMGALPAGDDYGYEAGMDDYAYDNVGAPNPYTGGGVGGGSPYADLGYEEEVLPEFDTGYDQYDDYYDQGTQPMYDYGSDYGDYGGDVGGFGDDYYPFDGELPENIGEFDVIVDEEDIEVPDEVMVRAIKIEWNKELVSRLKEKGKAAKAAGMPTKGILAQMKDALTKVMNLEEEEAEEVKSNAAGSMRPRQIAKAKRSALNKRAKVNPRIAMMLKARMKRRGRPMQRPLGGGRGMNISTTRPTMVQRGVGAQIAPQRIVVPAEARSSATGKGTGHESWEDPITPTGHEIPVERIEISSDFIGKSGKKIPWLWIGVGVGVAAVSIWALNKYKVIK